ncbi:MAG: Gfo/Idh/MocA family oxidoreductase [Chloroflexota bacterium]
MTTAKFEDGNMTVRVGVIGTSAWAERMYMQALKNHPDGAVTAVCARDHDRTHDFARRWNIPNVYTDWRDLLDSDIDAVIIVTPNHTHYPITMHALKNDLHVLCEKPLALNYVHADTMATEAERRNLIGMTAFTQWFYPHHRYIATLMQQGIVGTPYSLNLRHNSATGITGNPAWRFDRRQGGEGALFDIGSHAVSLARAFLGDIAAVSANLPITVPRPGIPGQYRASDQAFINLQFTDGTPGIIHVTMVSHQAKTGGQKQAIEISGSKGTLYYYNDFSTRFSLQFAQHGDDAPTELHVPDIHWPPQVSRANPRDMYADLFQKSNTMARAFVRAVADDHLPNGPDLREGAEVQKVLDAAIRSHQNNNQWEHIT